MTGHKVATRGEWRRAREDLLRDEKELTRRGDELARRRRELPWLRIDKEEYRFETDDGGKTLPELFNGHSQLLAYQFMFGPAYDAGCPVCSSAADTFDGAVAHLNARDVTFVCISRAPLDRLQAYRRRMGWHFPWFSSAGSDWNFDVEASYTDEQVSAFLEAAGDLGPVPYVAAACGTDPAGYMTEAPALNAFVLADGVPYQTYSTTARGLEPLMGYYGLLDLAPKGRDEGDPPQFWVRRHDEY